MAKLQNILSKNCPKYGKPERFLYICDVALNCSFKLTHCGSSTLGPWKPSVSSAWSLHPRLFGRQYVRSQITKAFFCSKHPVLTGQCYWHKRVSSNVIGFMWQDYGQVTWYNQVQLRHNLRRQLSNENHDDGHSWSSNVPPGPLDGMQSTSQNNSYFLYKHVICKWTLDVVQSLLWSSGCFA